MPYYGPDARTLALAREIARLEDGKTEPLFASPEARRIANAVLAEAANYIEGQRRQQTWEQERAERLAASKAAFKATLTPAVKPSGFLQCDVHVSGTSHSDFSGHRCGNQAAWQIQVGDDLRLLCGTHGAGPILPSPFRRRSYR